MTLLIIAFIIILAIFITLSALSLDDERDLSKIARVLLVVMVICCLMACYVFFNWCLFFRDGFC